MSVESRYPGPWRPAVIGSFGRSDLKDAQWSFDQLQLYLESIHRGMYFGPVPGAYFPLQWIVEGAPITTGQKHRIVAPVKMKPIAVTVNVLGGDVTIDLNDDGTSFLSAAIDADAGSTLVNSASDFATDQIGGEPSTLRLDVDSVDAGAPTSLSVLLVCKALDKIEPVEV